MGVKIFFAGDFLVSNETNKDIIISGRLQKMIDECDITCCNFEGPLVLEEQNKMKKIGPNIKNNIKNIEKLINSRFNLFCLANNHIFDYGRNGIENTINYLKNKEIDFIGADINQDGIYKEYERVINGIKIGIINVAENGFGAAVEDEEYGYAYMLHSKVFENIKTIRETVDVLIMVVHAGAEHWNVPLPEIRNLYKNYIDLGVDLVIGHHPHVPQGIEEYKNGLIFYSLGNFAFDMGNGPQNENTYSVVINIDENKKITYEIVPTIFANDVIDIDYTEKNILVNQINENNNILLDEKVYMELINKKCLELYKYYQKSYARIFCIYKGSFKERIKGFIKKYMIREKFQDIWLYHNINIETHLWICKRASRLLLKEKNIL